MYGTGADSDANCGSPVRACMAGFHSPVGLSCLPAQSLPARRRRRSPSQRRRVLARAVGCTGVSHAAGGLNGSHAILMPIEHVPCGHALLPQARVRACVRVCVHACVPVWARVCGRVFVAARRARRVSEAQKDE